MTTTRRGLLAAGAIPAVTLALIFFGGGIDIGSTNHVGMLPVVRRLLDPAYLTGDFGITCGSIITVNLQR